MSTRLFSPISLRELTLANRIVVSPMCQYSAKDGNASDWHLMHLGKFSISGPGLVIVEATAIEARGRITYGDLGLYSDDNEAALQRIVAFYRQYGEAKIGIQLAHAGRKARTTCLGRNMAGLWLLKKALGQGWAHQRFAMGTLGRRPRSWICRGWKP
jgi:2,4-dienoyl-CoA reductase-like NADH-dependent reductase (Old Yellow Enzyme family)